MKLTIFRSSKGDSLLISHPNGNGKNTHILVDGGMKGSFEGSVAPYLNKEIKAKNEQIDLLCVSHIDDDHIVGVVTLMELLAKWRVFNHHANNPENTANLKKPKVPEPPKISSIWHNSFAESYDLGESLPKVANALLSIEQMTAEHIHNELLHKVSHKAASIKNGITLSQRVRPEQLNIALNPQYNRKLVKCNQSSIHKNEHKIDQINLSVIGPFSNDLTELEKEWIAWEKKHSKALKEFYADLSVTALDQPLSISQISQLLINSGSLGDREDVSIPNLASIMFLVEVDGKSILMTGDGHSDDIIKGLKKNQKLNQNGGLHVDVLKVQHHGAAANIDKDFCKKITADHYVFCGNGTHTNPEEIVLEIIFNSRTGTNGDKSNNNKVDQPFSFWFSSNPKDDLTENQKKHMQKVKRKMEKFKSTNQGFDFNFMDIKGDFLQIKL
nr:MBL fold metallo-hydrolase [uncultured Allomuricauda sp.]